jgi:hypothetical protein
MTDEQGLYLALVVLYLIECATWVQRGAAAFIAKAPERAAIAFPRRGLSNNRGGAVIGRLLPGAVATFVVPQWPVSLAKEGVLGWVAESLELAERAFQTGLYRRFEDVDRVRADGRDVIVGRDTLITAASPKLAGRVAAEIARVRDLPKTKRPAAIEEMLAGLFDVAGVRSRTGEFWKETRALRVASMAVAAVAFIGAPAAVIALGIEGSWYIVLGALYLATWVVAVLFFRAHRRLSPASGVERIGQVILVALLPISAMRASDGIARTLLHGFHPLAVAAALAPRDALERLTGHLLRDATFPRRPACLIDDPEAEEVESWYRGALRRRIEELAKREGLDTAAMTAAPAPRTDDAGARRYCPRCLEQYGEDTEACGDCGGVPVRALTKGAS